MDNSQTILATAFEEYQRRTPIHARTICFCQTEEQALQASVYFGQRNVRQTRAYAGMSRATFAKVLAQVDAGELDVVFCGPSVIRRGLQCIFNVALVLAPTKSFWAHVTHYSVLRDDCPAPSIVIDLTDNVPRHGVVKDFKGRVFARYCTFTRST